MTELTCFSPVRAADRKAHVVAPGGWAAWLAGQSDRRRDWLAASGFQGKAGSAVLLPAEDAGIEAVLVTSEPARPWDGAVLHAALPDGTWALDGGDAGELALGWALAAYRFERYRRSDRPRPVLALPETPAAARAEALARSFYLARDLVNTPANDLGPAELAAAVEAVAGEFDAGFRIVIGDELESGYPMIHAVGQASPRAPRLIELTWGDPASPRLTLVGKGVCFDTGGLDIKPSAGMLPMKKDMGGAALMLALSRFVMASGLDVRLRLLIPAVENAVGGSSFRPGDILRSRKGLTVEIGNTDAEGRLVLADALADADTERPALLLDAATLTGAARVALGTEIPGLFTPDDRLAEDLAALSVELDDPVWRLPLHAPYRRLIDSPIADINNAGSKPFAGSITAALFLADFVTETRSWAHLDIYALNDEARPGRPRGGEATALRALATLVERRFPTR
ncbi:MAG TPA: leucyl aminopeptidase family protein [Geminicoccaceae bacterium]|nr:leucyl aminopeptidase family protein [Geminicoccus sp.]HMU49289.1 leucyl aminopeptidase family protein [Geminicoccaceae bacterium]